MTAGSGERQDRPLAGHRGHGHEDDSGDHQAISPTDAEPGPRRAAERHLDQHRLGCLGRLVVQPGRPGQQLGAQLLGGRLAQVGERRLGRRPAGHLEAQLGEAERPGDERPYDVDRLEAVEPHPPRAAEQDTGLETQVLAADEIAGRAPGHVAVDDAERDARRRCRASSHVHSRSPTVSCWVAMTTAAANTFQPRSTGVSGCSRRNADGAGRSRSASAAARLISAARV